MQTFLPYRDFRQSARVLDNRRLGKQRVETMQIMAALAGESKGWVMHPAVRMWRGHEGALMRYQQAICEEWVGRGFMDTCLGKTASIFARFTEHMSAAELQAIETNPWWLGKKVFHASHRSNLLRKDEQHYGRYPGFEDPDLAYFWPPNWRS